jgi:cytochrome c oxidase assembly protein subunit 15
VRQLGLWALGIVILQGIIGGQRVILNAIDVPWFHMSLGEMLRIPHGILAQVYVCVLIAIAVACSKSWIEHPKPVGAAVRRIGLLCTILMFVQLVIATTMRHNAAGLAIYTFPYSTPAPDNHWLPNEWNFRIAIHFAHRVMALVLAVALPWFASAVWRDRAAKTGMKAGALALVVLLGVQVVLGAQIIWTMRRPEMTTGHVVVGALTLAVIFWMTWVAHRDRIECRPQFTNPARA